MRISNSMTLKVDLRYNTSYCYIDLDDIRNSIESQQVHTNSTATHVFPYQNILPANLALNDSPPAYLSDGAYGNSVLIAITIKKFNNTIKQSKCQLPSEKHLGVTSRGVSERGERRVKMWKISPTLKLLRH
jgi:hypothetical protein